MSYFLSGLDNLATAFDSCHVVAHYNNVIMLPSFFLSGAQLLKKKMIAKVLDGPLYMYM